MCRQAFVQQKERQMVKSMELAESILISEIILILWVF